MKPRPLHLAAVWLAVGLVAGRAQTSDPTEFLRHRIQPILARCFTCHSGPLPTGELNLSSRELALKGGKSGVAIVPGVSARSLIYQMVSSQKMPPGDPLAPSEIEAVRAWIDHGAAWPEGFGASRAGEDWWALQPLARPSLPGVRNQQWVRNPIDAFILAKLESRGLRPSPPASRVKLIRRVTYDLHGLPPTPEEIAAFVSDPSPRAYEKLLDRLLASPRYGERWGRHWLDVARFGESQGYERDKIRDHAWRYRDYVIESFNQDKPYLQFVKEQLAGDVLEPITQSGIVATGFLVSGPWDEVGNQQQSAVMRERVREEELEDVISVVSQTFLGMTVNCARCHDHKFDPIPQRDYYRLKAALEGVWHGDRSILTPAETQDRQMRLTPLERRIRELHTELSAIEEEARRKVLAKLGYVPDESLPKPIARWTFDVDAKDSIGGLHGAMEGGAKIADGRLQFSEGKGGVRTQPLAQDLREKSFEVWVRQPNLETFSPVMGLKNPKALDVNDTLAYSGKNEKTWNNSSEHGNRTGDAPLPPEIAAPGQVLHLVIVYSADNRIAIYRNGALYRGPYLSEVKGPEGKLQLYPAGEAHVQFGGGFVEIDEARLYDRVLTAQEIARSSQAGAPSVGLEELLGQMSEYRRGRREELRSELTELGNAFKAFPPIPLGYAASPRLPHPTFVLDRGDPAHQKEPVAAGGLSAIRTLMPDFGLGTDAPEGLRRLKLAEWIASPDNPLTARVMANRVWHYHFGLGIVDTPSDFGFSGGRPSHPELLDWLATELIAHGWSVKKLHKLILLSSAYMQSSTFRPKAAQRDSENRLLWRFSPRRLEGEAIRDAMLAVSDQLNPDAGGPSFRPFDVFINNSHFYTLTDPIEPQYNRRTVYRINVNSAKSPFLENLDCPDPSTKIPSRSITTTPLQALSLMNSSFVLRQVRHFAERLRGEAGDVGSRRIRKAYRLALGRPPNPAEMTRATSFAREHGLESFCWTLLNASEFVYVE